jgi:hypothetical protein
MSFLTCCGRSRGIRDVFPIVIVLLLLPIGSNCLAVQQPDNNVPVSSILEEKLPFPPPIQWRMGEMEVSLIGLAWGPANSPDMLPKGREVAAREKPTFLPDRPYALALCLRATVPHAGNTIRLSGLVRIKNVSGEIEYPADLTSSGFVPLFVVPAGVNDIAFKGTDAVEHWEFFPVATDQKEFLFQVIRSAGNPLLSFRVILKGNKFVLVNASPGPAPPIFQMTKKFTGTIGAQSKAELQLTAKGGTLTGTERYLKGSKLLGLVGKIDSLGNFELKEFYPKDNLTGLLRGKFSLDYRLMTGYFSKPDGSRLEPFEFQEAEGTSPISQPAPVSQEQ